MCKMFRRGYQLKLQILEYSRFCALKGTFRVMVMVGNRARVTLTITIRNQCSSAKHRVSVDTSKHPSNPYMERKCTG